MQTNPILSFAGLWVPVSASYLNDQNAGSDATISSLIPIGPGGALGVVINGWGVNTDRTLLVPERVSLALFTPDGAGGLILNTPAYFSDPTSNGSQSVIVADFNSDGKADIFLAPYNEFPYVPAASTAFMSNADGTFSKITLSDRVLAHDAELVYLDGEPLVVTTVVAAGDRGDPNPIYAYRDGRWVELLPQGNGATWGASTALAKFGPHGELELVRGDTDAQDHIAVYSFTGIDSAVPTPALQKITPILSTLSQYQSYPSFAGVGLTHSPRLWAMDLNHDGAIDILGLGTMWNPARHDYPSALEVLINNGDGTFRDATANLNPDMGFNQDGLDYSPSFIDLDHSGIESLLFPGYSSSIPGRDPNYLLLNDGTGRLYIALHDQFVALMPRIYSFLRDKYASGLPITSSDGYYVGAYDPLGPSGVRFIGIPQADGSVNYLAEATIFHRATPDGVFQFEYAYVNVPLRYNPTTDFGQDVIVSDRSSSVLMRTWAGNDVFYDTNANVSPAHIDGGLGLNTSVYSDLVKKYAVSVTTTSIEIKHKGTASTSIDDTLVNIQKLQFSDASLDAVSLIKMASLSKPQVDSLTELYIASFNRAPDALGLDYWGGRYKDGMALEAIAKSFFTQPETLARYPTTTTNEAFVTTVYGNVLGRTPDAAGMKYWIDELANGHVSRDGFLLTILNGAHANPGATLDIANLNNKVSVGQHFALIQGLSNGAWSQNVMAGVTSTESTVAVANALTDSYAAIAAVPETSELVVKILGSIS